MSEPKSKKPEEGASSSAPSLSPLEAITADLGAEHLKEAQKKGYSGYVWDEDKTEYTATQVGNHDQSGPDKKSGAYGEDEMLRDHFIRGDKLGK